jgi:hypothetical protein
MIVSVWIFLSRFLYVDFVSLVNKISFAVNRKISSFLALIQTFCTFVVVLIRKNGLKNHYFGRTTFWACGAIDFLQTPSLKCTRKKTWPSSTRRTWNFAYLADHFKWRQKVDLEHGRIYTILAMSIASYKRISDANRIHAWHNPLLCFVFTPAGLPPHEDGPSLHLVAKRCSPHPPVGTL